MCDGHDHHGHLHEDEIDLVDLLGTMIKRRTFIIWFIICFTVLGSVLLFVGEYRKSLYVSGNKAVDSNHILVAQNDLMFASYMFINKSDKQDAYRSFANSILFPAIVDTPAFGIHNGPGLSVYYMFFSAEDAERFMDKYNSFVEDFFKLKEYKTSMNEEVRALCLQATMAAISGKDITGYFDNKKDLKNCGGFNYYVNSIKGKMKHTFSMPNLNLEDFYFDFIINAVKDAKLSKLKNTDNSDILKVKIRPSSTIDVKKIIKYTLLFFIFSVVVALCGAFILEFLANNKKRLSGYWR